MAKDNVREIIEEVCGDICQHYCKWPEWATQEGKPEDWLTDDPESPCQHCPLDRLY